MGSQIVTKGSDPLPEPLDETRSQRADRFSRMRCWARTMGIELEGTWSILDDDVVHTSPRTNRISGSKNFRSSPQKGFLPGCDIWLRDLCYLNISTI